MLRTSCVYFRSYVIHHVSLAFRIDVGIYLLSILNSVNVLVALVPFRCAHVHVLSNFRSINVHLVYHCLHLGYVI